MTMITKSLPFNHYLFGFCVYQNTHDKLSFYIWKSYPLIPPPCKYKKEEKMYTFNTLPFSSYSIALRSERQYNKNNFFSSSLHSPAIQHSFLPYWPFKPKFKLCVKRWQTTLYNTRVYARMTLQHRSEELTDCLSPCMFAAAAAVAVSALGLVLRGRARSGGCPKILSWMFVRACVCVWALLCAWCL